MKRAIREHRSDFIAIAGVIVLALVIGGYILANQRAALPSWVPGLGSDRFELKAELETAQAVTPGQGQTVNISGIRVGDVTDVELSEGAALVTMEVENQYSELIHEDATMLLRPRTGLQDMTLELDPGSEGEPVEEGFTVPRAQTDPNVNSDQILASLDGDTQAYLRLLVEAGAEGLGPNGEELSAVFRRFEPTARDLARINKGLAERRANIARSITSLKDVSEELGRADTRLADFVTSSNAALGSFANQEASIRASLQEFPSALASTRNALASGDILSQELGPASEKLIPWAQALGPALKASRPAFRETVAPIRDQIRPFTTEVRPPIRQLADISGPLRAATADLVTAFGELNAFFNGLAFDPAPGDASEESTLFWLSWLNHNQNDAFTLQDGMGPLRRGLVLQSCQTAILAEITAAVKPLLKTLLQLSRIPPANDICPLDP